ncbi:MAG: hypothetical protein JXB05_20675, partial [Myxococcaceae bacterium]|nr:hypothetical protein [Myxococcaceae bacterium]
SLPQRLLRWPPGRCLGWGQLGQVQVAKNAAAGWLCAAFTLGCPAAQVKPPEPGVCRPEAVEAMEQLGVWPKTFPGCLVEYQVTLDIHQPGYATDRGFYREGPITSRMESLPGDQCGPPEGTLLLGRLWVVDADASRVMGRFTEAVLPDGRRVPVCFVLWDRRTGQMHGDAGSKPDAIKLPRQVNVEPVHEWP